MIKCTHTHTHTQLPTDSSEELAVLRSIRIHGKMDLSGLCSLFPHIKKRRIIRHCFNLKQQGWIKFKKTRTVTKLGITSTVNAPNVAATKKELYTEQRLF